MVHRALTVLLLGMYLLTEKKGILMIDSQELEAMYSIKSRFSERVI